MDLYVMCGFTILCLQFCVRNCLIIPTFYGPLKHNCTSVYYNFEAMNDR